MRIVTRSILNRRATLVLTLLSLTLGIMLVLGINHLRSEVKNSFNNTLSGTDLIVGARGGSLNLLLYSVFHIGSGTHSIRWQTYEELEKHSQVKWVVPLAMGDSHKGHRVVATTPEFFLHYAYGQKQALQFSQGKAFAGKYDVVIGAAVARKLRYQLGDNIVLAHGIAEVSLAKHTDSPFVIKGILAPTGTPVDKSLYISLAGMAAIHADWQSGVHIPSPKKATAEKKSPAHKLAHNHHQSHGRDDHERHGHREDHPNHEAHPHHEDDEHHEHDHAQSLSAILVGLKNRTATFTVQRQVNQYAGEPLQAILPGLALAELWQLVGSVEAAFNLIAWLVVVAGLLGMITSLLASLNQRQREFAILRSLGAGTGYLLLLILLEVLLVCAGAIILAVASLSILLWLLQPWLVSEWGIQLAVNVLNMQQANYLLAILLTAALLSFIPALHASRRSLQEGLAQRH